SCSSSQGHCCGTARKPFMDSERLSNTNASWGENIRVTQENGVRAERMCHCRQKPDDSFSRAEIWETDECRFLPRNPTAFLTTCLRQQMGTRTAREVVGGLFTLCRAAKNS